MVQENVKYSSEIIDDYFNTGDVEFEARTSKFVQRESQKGLTGLLFLQGLVFGFIKNPQASLNQL